MLKRILLPLVLSGTLLAQTDLRVFRADLSVSFGGVVGKLILHPAMLTFIDDERPEASFAVEKGDIEKLENENETVRIQLRRSVRDRSGETNRVVLRLATQGEASSVARWWGGGSAASASASESSGSANNEELVFSARRKKRFRSNTAGKLMITGEQVIFESTDNIADSRRWALRDIKELKLKNPYELDIEPFDGNKYSLELVGQGMSTDQYRILVDRVTRARTSR